MSQATQAAPPPRQPATPGPGVATSMPRPAPALSPAQHPATELGAARIPTMLARLRIGLVALTALFGIAMAGMLGLGNLANQRAVDDTAQLLRAQAIKSNLLTANALATNAFLVGGLESKEVRARYDTAVEGAISGVSDASEAQPADKTVLAALSQSLLRYTSAIEQARTTNRQGFPVGAAYLDTANTELTGTAIPLLDQIVTENRSRAENALDGQSVLLVVLPGVLVLGCLVWANQWIARRFRRRANVGIAVAAVIVLGLTLAAGAVTLAQGKENASLRASSFAVADVGSNARSAANTAKAQESLRLIKRGSGQVNEAAWDANATRVTTALATPGLRKHAEAWQTYARAHAKVKTLDNSGQWDAAVAHATGTEASGTTATFATFDNGLRRAVDEARDSTLTQLRSGNWVFAVLAVLGVIGGLVAAGAAWRGVSRRLEEYA